MASAGSAEVLTPAAGPRKKPFLLGAVAGLVLLGALGAGGWLVAPRLLGPRGGAEQVEEAVKHTVPLGPIVVNLSGETRRYVRAGVSLGLTGPKDAKDVEAAKPQLLDLFISVLSSADAEALLTADGRTELKDEILGRIRSDLGLRRVARVYFTEFVVQ